MVEHAMLYFFTGSIFYWLIFKRAPLQEELIATHPAQPTADIIELFPGQEEAQAA